MKKRRQLFSIVLSVLLTAAMCLSNGVYSVYAIDDELPEETGDQKPLSEVSEETEPSGSEETDPEQMEESADNTETQSLESNQQETAPEIDQEIQDVSDTELFPAFSRSQSIDGVVVTVKAPEGVFPCTANLSVAKVSTTTQQEVDQAIAQVRSGEKNVVESYTFDIKILDDEGREIQPADGNKVSVSFQMAAAENTNLETNVYHVSDSEETIAAESVTKLDPVEETGDIVTVETDGFSIYTVEFTYGSLEYVLPGDTSVPLSEVLGALNLQGTVSNVEVSNPSLFKAEQTDGIWVLYALQPFTSTEWMKITIDGVVYEVTVTDTIPADVKSEVAMANGETKEGSFTISTGGYIFGPESGTATIMNGTITNNAVNEKKGNLPSAACDGSALIARNELVISNVTINTSNKSLALNVWNDKTIKAQAVHLNWLDNASTLEHTAILLGSAGQNKGTLEFFGASTIEKLTGIIDGGKPSDPSVIKVTSGTLTIKDSNIIFNNGIKIVVADGATLKVDNSTLKNAWIVNNGTVTIEGQSGQARSNLENCVMKNNSGSTLTISNAKLYNSNRNTSPNQDGEFETMIHGTNATISITDTEICDNKNTYNIRSPQGVPGASIISVKNGSITMTRVNAHDNEVRTNGGVMHAVDTMVTISDSTFKKNKAFEGELQIDPARGDWYGKGGALYLEGIEQQQTDDNITITNSTFEENRATEGGAIHVRCIDGTKKQLSVSISDSEFKKNFAYRAGGALVDWGDGTLSEIKGVLFEENTARKFGGAMGVFFDSKARGIHITSSDNNQTKFLKNVVTAGETYSGGALFIDRAHVYMEDVAIYDNTAPNAGGGLSACTVGTFVGKVLDGVAIFNNHVSKPTTEDASNLSDVFFTDIGGHHEREKKFPYYPYELYERMFNGGFHRWEKKDSNLGTDNSLLAKSNPTNKDITNAKVEFTQNEVIAAKSATDPVSGGAIACNGLLTIGTGTELKAVKIWDDNNNNDGYRPDPNQPIDWIKIKQGDAYIDLTDKKVTFKVLVGAEANNYVLDNNIAVVDADGHIVKFSEKYANEGDNAWLIIIDGNFPRYDDEHNIIEYTVEEDVSKFNGKYANTKNVGTMNTYFELTNKHEQELINIPVNKQWNDSNNQDRHRPSEVKVELLEDGEYNGRYILLKAENDWSGTFENLPVYKNGKNISYTVEEVPVAGYDVTITKSDEHGFQITNKHIPNTIEFPVSKTWVNDTAKKRPKTITFRLYADGKDTGKRLVLDAAIEWKGYFNNLVQKKDGKDIVYTITEEEITGYTAAISGDATKGFTVTNTYKEEKPKPTPTPTPHTPVPVPLTSDPFQLHFYRILLSMSCVLAAASLYMLRKYRR